MKHTKLAPLLAVTISLELMLSPMAFARREENTVSDTINGIINITATTYNQVRANQPYIPSMQMAGDMQAFRTQLTPLPDKYFNTQKLSQIPGLGQYLAMNRINPKSLSCVTLPTNLHESQNEVCRIGVTMDKGNPANQMAESFAYTEQYSEIDKRYRNFSSESNVGGELFGVGCMKNAMQVLNGFFKYRLDELDKLTTNVEAIQAGFKEASKADLEAIEETTAVLVGGNSEITNKVKSKRPDLFNFGKKFENPACNAMFTKDEFNKKGQGGLSAINQELQTVTSTKAGPMGFSGESYAKANSDIVADINNMADKIGKQAELNFGSLSSNYGETIRGITGSTGSPNRLNGAISPDILSDVQTKFAEKAGKMKATEAELGAEIGADAQRMMSLGKDPNTASAFETEITNFERTTKNSCLQSSSQLETVLSRIYDPSASKFANKNASNFMRDKLSQIINNDKSSFERKLSELRALESQQGARYYVRMENSYEVQELDAQGNISSRVVEASTSRTPSVFFSDVVKSCEAQFKANPLKSKYSGAQTVQKMRQLGQDYKSLAKTHSQEIKDAIRNRLLNCESPAKANASVAGSCKSESFNTSAPGFCAANAFACSKSMQDCSKQAEKIVTDIRNDRASRVTHYKALVDKNKKDVIKLFDSALSTYMKDGELLRGAFGAGFSSPSGIQRDVPEGQRFLPGFNQATNSTEAALLLEDPEKFAAMFKSNIQLLKKSVEDQQKQILGGDVGNNSGLLAKHIEDTKKKYTDVAKDAKKFANDCQRTHDLYVNKMENQSNAQAADSAKKHSEMGEHQRTFCQNYSMAQTNPGPACSGNIDSLSTAISGMGIEGYTASQEYRRVCAGAQNGNAGNPTRQALQLCNDSGFDSRTARQDTPEVATARKKHQTSITTASTELRIKTAEANRAKIRFEGMASTDPGYTDARTAKQSADLAVVDAQAALDSIEEFDPSSVASTTTTTTSTFGSSSVQNLCARLIECQRSEVYETGSGTNRTGTAIANCNDDEKFNAATAVVLAQGASINADEDLMPSFCNSMNGSAGNTKSFFDSINQGLQRGFAGGNAIGQ